VMTVNMQEIRDFLDLAHGLNADVVINPLNPDEPTASLDPLGTHSNRVLLTRSLQDGLDYAREAYMTTAVDSIKVMQDILQTTTPD
jgi:hypothetical protein